MMNTNKKLLTRQLTTLFLCIAMLVGTTFAWFTDSITNTGNIILSGSLHISAFAFDINPNGDKTVKIEGLNENNPFVFERDGINLSDTDVGILNETNIEPGKTNAKLIFVNNEGTLSSKIRFILETGESDLKDYLWFDLIELQEGNPLTGVLSKKSFTELCDTLDSREFTLKSNENKCFILTYGMNTNIGNEAQALHLTLDLTIHATQLNFEEDGFGNPDYDKFDRWDGQVTTDWYDESKQTYRLQSAADFAGFAKLSTENTFKDKTIILDSNIDLANKEWPSIANFSGTFDGNNHEILGLSGANAIFSSIDNGNVKNLKVLDASIKGNSLKTSILCNTVLEKATIENVVVSGNVSSNNLYTSGMIGAVIYTDDENEVVIKNCINYATVEGTDQVGGLVGCAYANTVFVNCSNFGHINGKGGYGAGGIAGFVTGYSDSTVAPIFKNCQNHGEVSGKNFAGGIAGVLGIEGGMGYYPLVTKFINCASNGNINGQTAHDICGGKVNYSGQPVTNLTIIIS